MQGLILIKDLGMTYGQGKTLVRGCIYECPVCHNRFTKSMATFRMNKTGKCMKCSRKNNSTKYNNKFISFNKKLQKYYGTVKIDEVRVSLGFESTVEEAINNTYTFLSIFTPVSLKGLDFKRLSPEKYTYPKKERTIKIGGKYSLYYATILWIYNHMRSKQYKNTFNSFFTEQNVQEMVETLPPHKKALLFNYVLAYLNTSKVDSMDKIFISYLHKFGQEYKGLI